MICVTTYVVEYQKRGLPHAHILLIVADSDRLRNPENVDSVISAELPPLQSAFQSEEQKLQAKRLHKINLKCMIHGPCGVRNPRSPCMIDGKCSKGYPKPLSMHTSWTQWSSYPSYKRRSLKDGGLTAIVGDHVVDNSWVVPYNPFLSLKYEAHINVEACISPFAAKYLFLYINKVRYFCFRSIFYDCQSFRLQGNDRAMVKLAGEITDEIEHFENMRCIGSVEACARIFSLPQSERYPSVQQLSVHLPKQQVDVFHEGSEQRAVADEGKSQRVN